ncbi:phosphatases II, partial [Auriscalpium vulgare]
LPPWLRKAHDHDHINHVLQVLADRERARSRARASSRPRADIQLKHRLPNVPALLHTKNPLSDHYSVAIACAPENRLCNRYSDIEPYDRTRVLAGRRYFNGNWVRERAGGRWAIATQAPLPHTAHEFLSLIAGLDPGLRPPGEPHLAFHRVRTVVQLTPTHEDGRQKAHVYFPSTPGESWVIQPQQGDPSLPPLKVTLLKSEAMPTLRAVVSTISVSPLYNGTPKYTVIFHHLLYHAWPDHGIPEPEDRASLVKFVRLVYSTNADTTGLAEQNPDPDPPVMVNCSAGVGRTGAFLAISSLLRTNNLLGFPPPPSTPSTPYPPTPLAGFSQSYFTAKSPVAQEVDSLREQRPNMVQRPEQTVLIYEVLIAGFIA